MRVQHNIPPVWDGCSEILILGSFPSVASRSSEFFYAHEKNRFWRVLAAVYGDTVPADIEAKKLFLNKHRVALWDVIASCDISASSDSSIKNAAVNDIASIVHSSRISHIYLNGKTAARLYEKFLAPSLGVPFDVLPSTSPANAKMSLDALIEQWRKLSA